MMDGGKTTIPLSPLAEGDRSGMASPQRLTWDQREHESFSLSPGGKLGECGVKPLAAKCVSEKNQLAGRRARSLGWGAGRGGGWGVSEGLERRIHSDERSCSQVKTIGQTELVKLHGKIITKCNYCEGIDSRKYFPP